MWWKILLAVIVAPLLFVWAYRNSNRIARTIWKLHQPDIAKLVSSTAACSMLVSAIQTLLLAESDVVPVAELLSSTVRNLPYGTSLYLVLLVAMTLSRMRWYRVDGSQVTPLSQYTSEVSYALYGNGEHGAYTGDGEEGRRKLAERYLAYNVLMLAHSIAHQARVSSPCNLPPWESDAQVFRPRPLDGMSAWTSTAIAGGAYEMLPTERAVAKARKIAEQMLPGSPRWDELVNEVLDTGERPAVLKGATCVYRHAMTPWKYAAYPIGPKELLSSNTSPKWIAPAMAMLEARPRMEALAAGIPVEDIMAGEDGWERYAGADPYDSFY